MKTLDYPRIDNIELWDDIVSRKHNPAKGRLLSVREKVEERYDFYSEHFDSLEEIQNLPESEWMGAKEDLIKCYGENIEFKKVRHEIFDVMEKSNQTKCPYCFLNRPNTLDHYFDKDDYPEFSVFVPNLVPCCSECNTNKSTSVFDENETRKYIHFYHDVIPSEQFLFMRFTYPDSDKIPIVNIYLEFESENNFSAIVRNHFSNLSLLKKYKNAVLDRLAPIIEEIRMFSKNNKAREDVVEILETRYNALAKHYGKNYWETCIYDGILHSSDFLESCYSEN